MRIKWTWMMGLFLGCICLAAPAPAQDTEDYDEPDEPQIEAEEMGDEDESTAGDIEMRVRPERPGDPERKTRGPKSYNLDRLERQMKKDLDLDEEQTEEIERLFEERREAYVQELAEQKDRMREQREKMGELLEQAREARRSGDHEVEREISDEIRALHEAVRVEQVNDEFLQQLEEQLYENQIEPFRKMAAQGRPGSDLIEAARQRPGLLRRYVLRLNLEDDKRQRLQELYEEVLEEMRSGDLSHQERQEQASEFYEQVMELLSEEEKARLMKHLGKDAKRSRRPSERGHDRDRDLDPHDQDRDQDEPSEAEAHEDDEQTEAEEEEYDS